MLATSKLKTHTYNFKDIILWKKTIVTLSSKEQTSIYGGDMKRIYNWEPRKDKNPKPQVIWTNN